MSGEDMARITQAYQQQYSKTMGAQSFEYLGNWLNQPFGITAGSQMKYASMAGEYAANLQKFKFQYLSRHRPGFIIGATPEDNLLLTRMMQDATVTREIERGRLHPISWWGMPKGLVYWGTEKLWLGLTGSDWEEQERMELATKRGQKLMDQVDVARKAKTELVTQRPEYKAYQKERAVHFKAVEEMKYHKYMAWSPY